MMIPVINVSNGRAYFIDLSEILNITPKKKSQNEILIYTYNGTYRPPRSLDDYFQLLHMFGFDMLHKSNLVHMKKLVGYDRKEKEAIFDNGSRSSVSRNNLYKIAHLLK